MADVISINAEGMNKLINEFDEESERVRRVLQMLQADMEQCKGGGWIADAADSYYSQMESEVLPSVERLSRSLNMAAEVMNQVMDVFGEADEEGGSYLRSG